MTPNELAVAFMPLVYGLVGKMVKRLPFGQSIRDDLVGAGMLALVESSRRYDPAVGQFANYAGPRISGALLDELRRMDALARPARTVVKEAQTVRAQFADIGAKATVEQIATLIGVTPQRLREAERLAAQADTLWLDAFATGDFIAEATELTPEQALDSRETVRALHAAIDELPVKHRVVVRDYYLRRRRQDEIAADLGYTSSRISQIQKEAATKLRPAMLDYAGVA